MRETSMNGPSCGTHRTWGMELQLNGTVCECCRAPGLTQFCFSEDWLLSVEDKFGFLLTYEALFSDCNAFAFLICSFEQILNR